MDSLAYFVEGVFRLLFILVVFALLSIPLWIYALVRAGTWAYNHISIN